MFDTGQAAEAVSEPIAVLTPLARPMSLIDLDSAIAQWGEGSSWWAYEPTANLLGYMRANTATVLPGEDGAEYRVLHPKPLPVGVNN